MSARARRTGLISCRVTGIRVRAAALLHDVTHIPYGHNIEDQTGLLPRHDLPERFELVLGDTELGRELDRQGLRDDVLAVLTGRGRRVPYICGARGLLSAGGRRSRLAQIRCPR